MTSVVNGLVNGILPLDEIFNIIMNKVGNLVKTVAEPIFKNVLTVTSFLQTVQEKV